MSSKVFEFHFNPKQKSETTVFDSFCFLPKTFYEKKQGHLYIVAEIASPNPKSSQTLNQLAEVIKKYFFQKPIFSSHDSFQLALNQASDLLLLELQNNSGLFLNNLHFAAIVVGPKCNIKVSKTGNIKIVLFRSNEAFDIGANFANQPLSNKVFPDVIEGNLQKGDRLLLSTAEVFHSLQAEKILDDLSQCQKPKLVKQAFKQKKKIVREFSGACLLAFVKKQPIISFLTRFAKK